MRKRNWLGLILCLGLITACENKTGSGGGDTAGNGGDDVAMDFVNASRKAVEIVNLNPNLRDRVSIEKLRQTVEGMQVKSTEATLTLRGEEKTAINYPASQSVVVNRPRWKTAVAEAKPAFALHECLGLMGIEDKSYVLSTELLEVDPVSFFPLRGQADILIIVDDSGSMATHQANLALHIEHLWAKIRERRLNFQIAVTTSSRGNHGQFLGATKVITSSTPQGLDILKANIQAGTQGQSDEQFFGPIHDGINLAHQSGFIRSSANLELIFLTDAEDQTPGWSPLSFAQYLWTLKGDASKVFAYGIIPFAETDECKRDYGRPDRLTQFISLVRGDLHDICVLSPVEVSDIGTQISAHVRE